MRSALIPTVEPVAIPLTPARAENDDGRVAAPDPQRRIRLALTAAITERRVVRVTYRSEPGGAPCEREIEPLTVAYGPAGWSVLAYCRMRGDIRSFRCDRIDAIALTDDHYSARKGLSLERFIQRRKRALPSLR